MLNKAYDYYFFNYTDTPLLVVKTDSIDFVANPEHFDDLIEQIHKPISGKKYYVPSADIASR
jgi:deoxyadenosine/deoxycytidine kinase